MREVRWERMFPDQLEAAFARCPLLYLAYGLCEPHGPQNAVGLDALKAHALCVQAAEAAGGIVAPVDYWHIHEVGAYAAWGRRAVGEPARRWMSAMPPWQHFKNVCYHIRAAEAIGFHAVILLTGHYGPNWQDLKTLVALLQPHVAAQLYALPDFEINKPGFKNDNKSGGDHAGQVETSLLWALDPACVDMSRLPPPPHQAEDPARPGAHFAMGATAPNSNRLTGERMVLDIVAGLVSKAGELLETYDAAAPRNADEIHSFEDVERFWEREVSPRLAGFETLKPYLDPPENVRAIPADSVWAVNNMGPFRD